jgi:hypothetical protein
MPTTFSELDLVGVARRSLDDLLIELDTLPAAVQPVIDRLTALADDLDHYPGPRSSSLIFEQACLDKAVQALKEVLADLSYAATNVECETYELATGEEDRR